MDQLTGKPRILKQANLSLIRKVIKEKGTATRAEIAQETKISSTTVRALLNEMMLNQEIESIGHDESSGGRKAERYRFLPNRYYSVVFCISDCRMDALLVNICGEIVEVTQLGAVNENYEQQMCSFLDDLMARKEIKAIGLGVQGIVEGGSYWKKRLGDEELHRVDIGSRFAERYQVPVILENDLNAITIGFGQCYGKKYPNEKKERMNMAYLHFEEGCISAGFIAGGKIIRGCNNFAGELGLIPAKGDMLLDACMAEPMEDEEYTQIVTQILSWICGVLNPEYIALGGPDLRKDCVKSIGSLLVSILPRQMAAEILYSDDVWNDYHNGMAFLTAGKMFEEIQFRKE